MANFKDDRPDNGSLEVEVAPGQKTATVYFIPHTGANSTKAASGSGSDKIRLLDLSVSDSSVLIHPIDTRHFSERFLGSKYQKVASIEVPFNLEQIPQEPHEIEELLESLPRGLTKDFQYGLGLPREYRFIVDTIEEFTDCSKIVLSRHRPTQVDGVSFVFATTDFENLRAELDRVSSRGQSATTRVKMSHARNILAPYLGIDEVQIGRGRHPMSRVITDMVSGQVNLGETEQDELIEAAVAESKVLAERRPDVLAKLRSDIQLVSLEALIETFAVALEQSKGERYWQSFFNENPFALHLVFGFPVIKVQGQASVGGMRLSGVGEKIADFLIKNSLTDNVGLIEIKRPSTSVLRSKAYREGIYGPSKELADSVSQVLDQKYQLEKSLKDFKDSSHNWNLESYSIKCCLVIGMMPADQDKKKSFDLFRNNLRNVEVITYDELLEKLSGLRAFLKAEEMS